MFIYNYINTPPKPQKVRDAHYIVLSLENGWEGTRFPAVKGVYKSWKDASGAVLHLRNGYGNWTEEAHFPYKNRLGPIRDRGRSKEFASTCYELEDSGKLVSMWDEEGMGVF